MERLLGGRSVLVVEDEPLVALDLMEELKSAGARVVWAQTVNEALREVECPDLSAAILDHGLMDGTSSQVCERLKKRDIPFINYTGYGNLDGDCSSGVLVPKPTHPQELVTLIIGLLRAEPGTTQTP
jgi:DNA-binding response OmpR family regulator